MPTASLNGEFRVSSQSNEMIIYFGRAGLNGNTDLKHNSSVQRGTNVYGVTECSRIVWGKNMAKEQGREVRQ